MTELRLWAPKHELAFLAGLTEELPPGDAQFTSPRRPITKRERVQALERYVAVLPTREFPLWTEPERQMLLCEAHKILRRARQRG